MSALPFVYELVLTLFCLWKISFGISAKLFMLMLISITEIMISYWSPIYYSNRLERLCLLLLEIKNKSSSLTFNFMSKRNFLISILCHEDFHHYFCFVCLSFLFCEYQSPVKTMRHIFLCQNILHFMVMYI